ncbi:hypothetical protein FTUN_1650 [Frigoriglobus tundricola]|uniref:Uncharacterized protein n=1 Tax=Frigoriglobus tundricola TaxID=2774151 RepID=A0A6M5YLH7_9BACT|nr:hypothetical protein FTUN_1650 [Frigoriglobus tundricola]
MGTRWQLWDPPPTRFCSGSESGNGRTTRPRARETMQRAGATPVVTTIRSRTVPFVE